jgi:hypothetical protein
MILSSHLEGGFGKILHQLTAPKISDRYFDKIETHF